MVLLVLEDGRRPVVVDNVWKTLGGVRMKSGGNFGL